MSENLIHEFRENRELSFRAGRDLFDAREDCSPPAASKVHHLVRSLRSSSNSQAGVAMYDQVAGDRMKDLIEDGVADPL